MTSDNDGPPPRALMSLAFWAALAVGLALVLAGAVVGVFGARLFPPPVHAKLGGGCAAVLGRVEATCVAGSPAGRG